MSIPVVIFHISGEQEYFKKCVNLTSKCNTVYLIGDNSNKNTFADNKNVQFFHIKDLGSDKIEHFKRVFVNYSDNNHDYELYCFLRVFYLQELFKKTGQKWVFHTDSDCVLLEDINNIFPTPKHNAYSVQKMENQYHMVGSIHNALLNMEFCDKFIQLCFDIYDNRTKFELINQKIKWHKNSGVPGGICDMTLYYLLYSEKIIEDIIDLNVPIQINNEYIIFDHNVLDPYGYRGENTYKMQNKSKIIAMSNNQYYFQLLDEKLIKTVSIHFQGAGKQILVNYF